MLLMLEGGEPLYLQVYRALSRAIEGGRFPLSTRLPGTRTLARELGVSRTVVLQAFERLESEGLIAGSRGSGTYVRGRPQPPAATLAVVADLDAEASAAPPRTDLLPPTAWAERVLHAMPARVSPREEVVEDLIDLSKVGTVQDDQGVRRWRQALLASLDEPAEDPRDIRGLMELRRSLALELRQSRAIHVDPDDILIVAGIQQARDLVARVMVHGGMSIAVEEPSDPAVRATFAAAGARVLPCTVGAAGLDAERCVNELAQASLAYVMPAQQFPSGVIMGAQQRLGLLRWAYRYGAYVIEDDFEPEHRLVSTAAPPLLAMDQRNQVIHIGALAREFPPGLHMAYVIAPPVLRPYFEAAKWIADHGPRLLTQRALARYLASGDYQSNLRRLFVLLAEKRSKLVASLGRHFGTRASVIGDTISGALLVHFPDTASLDVDAWLAYAESLGVRVDSARAWYAQPPGYAVLLLRYARTPLDRLDEAVQRLAAAQDKIMPPAASPAMAC